MQQGRSSPLWVVDVFGVWNRFSTAQGCSQGRVRLCGQPNRATYQDVCAGTTGHAEVVKITFDPHVISYEDILNVFFATHDPTTLNRRAPTRERSIARPFSTTRPNRKLSRNNASPS